MSNNYFLEEIKTTCENKISNLNWSYKDVATWLDGVIFSLSCEYTNEFMSKIYELKNDYLMKGNEE